MNELLSIIYPLAIISFATSITPGPNNILLLASGANYGYVRTLPHILGVNIGYNGLILLSILGLEAVFSSYPILKDILRFVGSAYLLYLAWRVLNAGNPKTNSKAKPFRFYEAVLFQFVNPKAILLAITIIGNFATGYNSLFLQVLVILSVTLPLSFFVSSVWALFGIAIANFLQNARNLKIFNATMAGALVISIYWIIN